MERAPRGAMVHVDDKISGKPLARSVAGVDEQVLAKGRSYSSSGPGSICSRTSSEHTKETTTQTDDRTERRSDAVQISAKLKQEALEFKKMKKQLQRTRTKERRNAIIEEAKIRANRVMPKGPKVRPDSWEEMARDASGAGRCGFSCCTPGGPDVRKGEVDE